VSASPSALFAYPKQAEFGRPLPKNKLYEKADVGTRLKALFVAQVEQIVWRYKLAPETINLPAKPGVPEIQVFAIQLKTPELHRDVLRCIDSAVQFPIVFELTHGHGAQATTQVVAAYKRPSEADATSWVCSDYFESGWIAATAERAPLPLALDLGGLYEQLLRRLVPVAARPNESLGVQVIRAKQVRAKEHEVAQAQARLAKEKQFNRKVEANSRLRQLTAELQALRS
jgi:hypothetical protein